MNLSPAWCEFLNEAGHEAVHWSQVADPTAPDHAIVKWEVEHAHIVLTHDLDFGAILAASGANSPSVIQARVQDITPAAMGETIANALIQFSDDLAPALCVNIT